MKPVGILGGMGPEATILLMQKVLGAVRAADDADHIPLIVHQNPQVPSRIAHLIEGTGPDPADTLAAMARDLQRAGAMALAMPCNTAHHYAGAVSGAVDLPFLDMVTLTANALAADGARRIGLLASPATQRTGVFDAAFAAHGLTAIGAPDGDAMLALIRALKAGQDRATLTPAFLEGAAALRDLGADHLLIACTEFSLLAPALPREWTHSDSLDHLVKEIVAFARG